MNFTLEEVTALILYTKIPEILRMTPLSKIMSSRMKVKIPWDKNTKKDPNIGLRIRIRFS